MPFDLKRYYEDNKNYFGDVPLEDVAKTVYDEYGNSNGSYDDWKKNNDVQSAIDDDKLSRNIKPDSSGFLRRYVADPAVSLGKGLVSLNDATIGLADLATGGYAGKKLEEATGYNSGKVQEFLESKYSPEQRYINQGLSREDGFLDKMAYAVKNPSTIAHSVIESTPSMVAGGLAARGLLGAAPKTMQALGSGVGRVLGVTPEYATPLLAGAIGEGGVQTTQAAEGIRQESPDKSLSLKGAGSALASGVFDSLIALGSGKVAQKFGIADKELLLAGGKTSKVYDAAGKEINKNIFRRTLEGALNEGLLQELPQSTQEQIFQNIGANKPWDEGLSEAAVMGTLSGAVMGGGASIYDSIGKKQTGTKQEQSETEQPIEQLQYGAPGNIKSMVDRRRDVLSEDAKMRSADFENRGVRDLSSVDSKLNSINRVESAIDTFNVNDVTADDLISYLGDESQTSTFEQVEKPSTAEESASVFNNNPEYNRALESALTIADGINNGKINTPYVPDIENDKGVQTSITPRDINSLSLDDLKKVRPHFEKSGRDDLLGIIDNNIADKQNNIPSDLRMIFGIMSDEINQGGIEGKTDISDTDKPLVVGKVSSHQQWVKDVNKLIAEHNKVSREEDRLSSFGKDQFNSIYKNMVEGKPLTDKQSMLWDILQDKAKEYNGKHPDTVDAANEKYFSDQGLSYNRKQPIQVEDLQFGDRLLIEKDGISESFEVKGIDDEGNVILKDGELRKIAPFDKIHDVVAVGYTDNPKNPEVFSSNRIKEIDNVPNQEPDYQDEFIKKIVDKAYQGDSYAASLAFDDEGVMLPYDNIVKNMNDNPDITRMVTSDSRTPDINGLVESRRNQMDYTKGVPLTSRQQEANRIKNAGMVVAQDKKMNEANQEQRGFRDLTPVTQKVTQAMIDSEDARMVEANQEDRGLRSIAPITREQPKQLIAAEIPFQEWLKPIKREFGDDYKSMASSFEEEYYAEIEKHVKGGGKISKNVFDSLPSGKKYHFSKHYGVDSIIDNEKDGDIKDANNPLFDKYIEDQKIKDEENKSLIKKELEKKIKDIDAEISLAERDISYGRPTGYKLTESEKDSIVKKREEKLSKLISEKEGLLKESEVILNEKGKAEAETETLLSGEVKPVEETKPVEQKPPHLMTKSEYDTVFNEIADAGEDNKPDYDAMKKSDTKLNFAYGKYNKIKNQYDNTRVPNKDLIDKLSKAKSEYELLLSENNAIHDAIDKNWGDRQQAKIDLAKNKHQHLIDSGNIKELEKKKGQTWISVDSHKDIVKNALKSGELSQEDYKRIHEKDYGAIEKFLPKNNNQPTEPTNSTNEKPVEQTQNTTNWNYDISDVQKSKLDDIYNKYKELNRLGDLEIYSVDEIPKTVFVRDKGSGNHVFIKDDGNGGATPEEIKSRIDSFGYRGEKKLLKHAEAIQAEKDRESAKENKRIERKNEEKTKERFVSFGAESYKRINGKWFRPDGNGGWVKHTKLKGLRSDSFLESEYQDGRLKAFDNIDDARNYYYGRDANRSDLVEPKGQLPPKEGGEAKPIDQIKQAITKLESNGDFLHIAKIRSSLPNMSKVEFDSAMKELVKSGEFSWMNNAQPTASLSQKQKDSMIEFEDDARGMKNYRELVVRNEQPTYSENDKSTNKARDQVDRDIIDSIKSNKYAKNWNIERLENGDYRVDIGNGKYFDLKFQDSISLSKGSVEQAYGKSPDEMRDEQGNLLIVAGSYSRGEKTIRIRRDTHNNVIFDHEFTHFLEHAGIISESEIGILKDKIRQMVREGKWETRNKNDIGGSEDRAQFIAESLEGRRNVTGLWNKIIQRINDFIDWVNDITGYRTADRIIKNIETGKALNRIDGIPRTTKDGNVEQPAFVPTDDRIDYAFAKSSNPDEVKQSADSVNEKTRSKLEKEIEEDRTVFKASKNPSIFDKWLLSPMYKKSPQMKSAFKAATSWVDDKFRYFNMLIHDTENNENYNKAIKDLKDKFPENYKRFNEYLLDKDRTGDGYYVGEDENNPGSFKLIPPADLMLSQKRTEETFASEKEAREKGRQYELEDYRNKYPDVSDLEINSLKNFRKIADNILSMRKQSLHRYISELEAQGKNVPDVVYRDDDGKEIKVNLKRALAEMDDLWGTYFPRQRLQGGYQLTATRKNDDGTTDRFMKYYDVGFINDKGGYLKNLANKAIGLADKIGIETMPGKRAELEKKGYIVEIKEAARMPENIFLEAAGKQLSIEKMLESVIQQIDDKTPKTLKDIGIEGKWRNNNKDYVIHDYSVLKGVTSDVLYELGAKYEYKQRGKRGWGEYIFENADKDIEDRIKKRLFKLNNINSNISMELAAILTEGMADLIRSHGARSGMLKRSENYWEGFENDPAVAITRSAQSVAGGEAKRTLAQNLISVINGTNVSLEEFKKNNPDLKGDKLLDAYQDMVKESKVDPASQSELWSDINSYMKDLLRNEEKWDRVVGQMTGLAVAKYLAFRVSSPIANLTAMVTTVPASMNAHSGIDFKSIPRLLTIAASQYTKYLARTNEYSSKLFKNPEDLKGIDKRYKAIFDAIAERGWDKAQYNYEAVSVLRNKLGQKWDRVMDWGMAMFGITEQVNRATTIAATTIGILEKEFGKSYDKISESDFLRSLNDSLNKAHETSNYSHGVYGKADSMYATRGADPMSNIFKSNLTFKKFAINYMMNLYKIGVEEKNIPAAAYMILSPAIVGGFGASMVSMIPAVLSAMGIGSDDWEEDFYEFVETNFGGKVEKFARYGIPGIAGLNFKGSVDVANVGIPKSLVELFGAPASVAKDVYEGISDISKGNVQKGIEGLVPNAFASISKAQREYTEGATKDSNAPIFYGTEPLKLDFHDAVMKALSFSPADMAEKKEKLWNESKVIKKYSEEKADILDKFRKHFLNPVDKQDKEKLYELYAEVSKFNGKLIDRNINRGMVSPITSKSIQTSLRRSFKPNKAERIRGATLSDLAQE